MEVFYSADIQDGLCRLDAEESGHCIKVLRHRKGDEINIIDGKGTLMECVLTDDSPKGATAAITGQTRDWGAHPYRLTIAVAPTKNSDRYEWFIEKACEIGIDRICPIICRYSERKVFKTTRAEKILLSASKQSLKGAVPRICGQIEAKDFIKEHGEKQDGTLKLIAYCFEDESHKRLSIKEALQSFNFVGIPEIIIMIGPEGDFSEEEAALAIEHGFIPVHLGPSRLRTETAAVTAAEAVYFNYSL